MAYILAIVGFTLFLAGVGLLIEWEADYREQRALRRWRLELRRTLGD